jgi:chitin disaccharide deacetylase
MPRHLIVNADDFGLSEAVSRGILEAHNRGILTSTTFMTSFPWAAEMAPLLQEAPGLGVGIHLNLTTGEPVSPPEQIPTLVTAQGRFSKSLLHLMTRADMGEVRHEWAAQVEKGIGLLEPLGRRPTHLDTHRYLQGHPAFAAVMIDVARKYGIPAVRCLYSGPDLAMSDMFRSWNPARLLVERYLRRSAELVRQSGLGCPDQTLAGDFDRGRLPRLLERVRKGVAELVCHPGRVDDRLRSLSSMQEHREEELAALIAPAARQQVAHLGLTLVHFGHLAH